MKFNPDNGAAIWENSGECYGPEGLPSRYDDSWSAAPFNPADMVTDTSMAVSTSPDRAGGTSSTS